jgi:Amt family ammonium transporter
MAIIVTHISASMGALTWMAIEWRKFGKPSALGAVTGMVAGLGTITPASGFVGPGGALIIGLLAGFVCFNATQYIKRVLKIDDSLDVFPVHGVGGILGSLVVAVFASTELGLFSGYGFAEGITSISEQFTVQAIGVAAVIVFTIIATFIILKVVGVLTGGLRVGEEAEMQGLDVVSHEESGYNL